MYAYIMYIYAYLTCNACVVIYIYYIYIYQACRGRVTAPSAVAGPHDRA